MMLSRFRRWLHELVNRRGQTQTPAPRRRRPSFRPALEGLESRLTPSTYFVDQNHPSSSDGGPGTESQPFRTINAATGRAIAGDSVLVNSGVYNERVTFANSGTAAAPIIVSAMSGANAVVTGQDNGFKVSSRSWITIRGFHVTQTVSYGIYVINSSNITIEANEVSYSGDPVEGLTAFGIKFTNSFNSRIVGNTAHHNSDAGIQIGSSSTPTSLEILNNVTYSNAREFTRAAPGIDVRSGGNTIAGNVSFNNEDSGIQIYSPTDGSTAASNNLIINNIAYSNGDHGIDVLRSPTQRIIGNSIYNNATAGINIEGGSTSVTLANNIAVDNGIDSTRTRGNIRVDAASQSGISLDYDVVHLRASAAGQAMFVWGTTSYSTLAAFQSATGRETRGIQADPLWVSPSTADFHLRAGSPAIDSANSGVSGQSSTDKEGRPRVDDPATTNTGAGPRTYDDRGAFEFIPSGNTPPTTTGIANITVDEDAADSLINLFDAFSDAEDPDSALTYAVRNNTNPGLFASTVINASSGTLTLDYAANQFGTATLTIRATDTGGLFVETSFTVTVNPINDAPTTSGIANVTVDEDAVDTVIDLFAAFADLEDADSALTYTVTGNTNPGLFTSTAINGVAGTLTLDYARNQFGTATLTIRATDTGALFVATSFTVTVNSVNDVPTTNGIADVTVEQNAPDTVINLFAAFDDVEDADNALTYTIQSNTNPVLFTATTINGAAGTLTLDYASDQTGSARLTIRAADTAGAFVETAFNVTVGARFIYVDQANPNPGDGTQANPFRTIGAAAAVAAAGETVVVAAGTYREMVIPPNSGAIDRPIVYTVATGASVVVTGQTNGFKVTSKSWITIRGFTITDTVSHGISVTGSSRVTIEGNDVSFVGEPISGQTAKGIHLSGTTDSRVVGNSTHHNSDSGIYLAAGTTRVEILRNKSYNNARVFVAAAAGIDVRSGGNSIIGNIVHHNEDSGIQVSALNGTPSAGTNLIANNVSYVNGDHGIGVLRSNAQRIISNSIYDNVVSGINVEGGSINTVIVNNISVDNGRTNPAGRGNLRVDAASVSGTVADYNMFSLRPGSASNVLISWGSVSYTSLAAFQSATGMEAHGIQADPLWVDPDHGDFHLRAGSAAIDSADSGVSGVQDTDAEGRARRDDPLTVNTGGGPITFYDRGAFEF